MKFESVGMGIHSTLSSEVAFFFDDYEKRMIITIQAVESQELLFQVTWVLSLIQGDIHAAKYSTTSSFIIYRYSSEKEMDYSCFESVFEFAREEFNESLRQEIRNGKLIDHSYYQVTNRDLQKFRDAIQDFYHSVDKEWFSQNHE